MRRLASLQRHQAISGNFQKLGTESKTAKQNIHTVYAIHVIIIITIKHEFNTPNLDS